jgi:N-acetylmuramoyl-L-alanine amidase
LPAVIQIVSLFGGFPAIEQIKGLRACDIRFVYMNEPGWYPVKLDKTMNRRMFGHLGLCGARAMRHGMPCVGLIVFMGCFTFLVAPDDNFAPVPHVAPVATARPTAHGSAVTGKLVALAAAPAEREPLPGNGPPTVIIDPGHGGIDDGTKYFGLAEKDVTLDVGQRLDRILKGLGVQTVMTRTDDVYVSLPDRAEIANMAAGTNTNVIFVSIHFNQSAVESVGGIETYYADKKIPPPTDWTWVGFFNRPEDEELDRGENLAADIQSAMVSRMLETNRGIKSRSLFVTRHTRMPAVRVEGGFLSNKIENQLLRNDTYRERIAQGLASGILTYIQTMHPAVPMRMAMVDTAGK